MALSEEFNLDFKFGGNSEFLVKLETLLNRIDANFDSFTNSVEETNDAMKETAEATKEAATGVDKLRDAFSRGTSSLGAFGDKLRDVAGYYISFQAAKMGAERVWSFGMTSMDAYSTQERAENQLKGVLQNRGSLDQFQAIKDFAAEIQGRSIYGDEAMIKGAGELATYVKGTESLKAMMDLLTNYAAGMTGGGEVSPEQMESLATGLGMAYDGNYMAMRRKGFDTSKLEALDAIVETGGVWGAKEKQKYGDVLDASILKQIKAAGGVTEQMRVDALKESLADWDNLSNAVNGLDSSALIRFNNKMGDLREEIGKRVYPVFNKLVDTIDSRMPDIEDALNNVADLFETFAKAIENNFDSIKNVVKLFAGFVEFVAKMPKLTISAGVSLKFLASGALFAKDGFASLNIQMKSSVKEIMAMKGAVGGLIGSAAAGGSSGLMADIGDDKSFGENAGGALAAMAAGAAMGAAKFGLMGAAIGATASTVVMLVRAIKDLMAALGQESKFAETQSMKNASYDKMMAARKKWKNSGKDDYRKNYVDYMEAVKEYEEFTGGVLPDYIQKDMKLHKTNSPKDLAKQAQKDAKGTLYQQFNTTNIEQKVSVAAEVEKIGLLLNQSVRAIIMQGLRRNREVEMVGGI